MHRKRQPFKRTSMILPGSCPFRCRVNLLPNLNEDCGGTHSASLKRARSVALPLPKSFQRAPGSFERTPGSFKRTPGSGVL